MGGVTTLLGLLKTFLISIKLNKSRELCCEKVLAQKGNSPKYLLRSIKKSKYVKIFC